MSAASALLAGRRRAESRMGAVNHGSDCVIRRKTGEMEQDESTGLEVPVWAVVHPGLPCRIGGHWGSGPSVTVNVAGTEQQASTRALSLPAATGGIADGDLVEITAGENAGTVWRIVEADWQDQATARRVPVTATDRPEEWD